MPIPISGTIGPLTTDDIRLEAWKLLAKLETTGTGLAARLGASTAHMNDFLSGRTTYPPSKLLRVLKIEKRILFVRINGRG
jgi:hypothetical protein